MNHLKPVAVILSLLALAGLTLLAGCSSDDDSPTGPAGGSTTQAIDPAIGGEVAYGDATVDIPAGALSEATDITVGTASNAPAYTAPANTAKIGSTYEFGPAGTTFSQPVTVTFDYDPAALGSYNPATLKIMTYDNAGQTPVALSNISVNTASHTVSGQVTHFSYFILVISTGGGGGVGNYPDPQGGNPVGNWVFDHVYYETEYPLPDSIAVEMSATGTGTLDITATDWERDVSMDVAIHYEYNIGGFYFEYDTTFTEVDHSWGTYQTDGTWVYTEVTGSETDPGSVGDLDSLQYTAEADRLIFYQSAEAAEYSFDAYVVYVR